MVVLAWLGGVLLLLLLAAVARLSLRVEGLARDVALLKGQSSAGNGTCLRSLLAWLALTGAAVAGSPAEAVAAAHADAVRLAKRLSAAGASAADLEGHRYFRVTTPPGKAREQFRAAFRLHLNLLSRYPEMIDVVEVRPDLWRLDLDLLACDRATLEAARFVDPFFHVQARQDKEIQLENLWPGGVDTAPGPTKGKRFPRGKSTVTIRAGKTAPLAAPWLPAKETKNLREVLFTEVPILDAEWFLAQSARQVDVANQENGVGYYDFLQLRSRKDYFRLVRFNEDDSVAVGKEMLAVQELSGVSPAPRLIGAFQATSGPLFVTFDTNKPRGRGIPLTDLRKGKFQHQIEEYYTPLPNGLPATYLSSDEGVQQNFAPADAAGLGDTSPLNRGKRVNIDINIACMRCHAGLVIRPVDDYVRKTFRDARGLGTPDKREFLRLRRQYFSDLDRRIARAREDYRDAFGQATVTAAFPKGMTAQEAAEVYAGAFHDYVDTPLTPALAARELGVRPEDFFRALVLALKAHALDTRLAPFTADPALPLTRQTWEATIPIAMELVSGFLPKR